MSYNSYPHQQRSTSPVVSQFSYTLNKIHILQSGQAPENHFQTGTAFQTSEK